MKAVFRSSGFALCSLLAVVALPLLASSAAQAQSSKIFVASFGNDANDGSRGSPKRNFQAAHDAVAASGQIVVLDTAGYGTLTITKSLAVTVPPGVNGFITATDNNNAITINTTGFDRVALRGLVVEGGGPANSGRGISAPSVGTLTIEGCTIRNFGTGIALVSSTQSRLYAHNSFVRECSTGLDMETTDAVALVAVITGCRLEQSGMSGVLAATGAGGGSVDLSMADCVVSGIGQGFGIVSENSGCIMRVSNCTITGHTVGVTADNGGQILSRGNNTLENNTNGNAFPSTYSAK